MWGDSRNKMRAVPSQYRSSSTVAVSSQSDTSTKKSEWTAGMSVYHDEYGNGTVIKVTPSQSAGPLVIVQFETGKTAQFFPKYTKNWRESRIEVENKRGTFRYARQSQ